MTAACDQLQISPATARTFEFLGAMRRHVDSTPEDQQRIHQTVSMIPSGVKTILDVGCGDGRIMRHLAGSYSAFGVDYAFTSVRNTKAPAVQGSSATLPFRDHSFDLVMSCEVLEHLSKGLFEQTLRELKRVARQYVLVSVPYKENLRRLMTKCKACENTFHIWGHVRSFSASDLDGQFAPFTPTAVSYVGRKPPYMNSAAIWCNQVIGKRWTEFSPTTMCPRCGNTSSTPTERNTVTRLCGAINLITSKCVPVTDRNWIIKLFQR